MDKNWKTSSPELEHIGSSGTGMGLKSYSMDWDIAWD